MTKETGKDCAPDTQEQARRADPRPPDRTDRGNLLLKMGLLICCAFILFIFDIYLIAGWQWVFLHKKYWNLSPFPALLITLFFAILTAWYFKYTYNFVRNR